MYPDPLVQAMLEDAGMIVVCEFDNKPMERTKDGWICRNSHEHPKDAAHFVPDGGHILYANPDE